MSSLSKSISEIQIKIMKKRNTLKNLENKSRGSSFHSDSPALEEIPKNTTELLQRYRNTRFKLPAYKQDAASLISFVLAKPLKRLFHSLKKQSKVLFSHKKNSKGFEKNARPPIPGKSLNRKMLKKDSIFVKAPRQVESISMIFQFFHSARSKRLSLIFQIFCEHKTKLRTVKRIASLLKEKSYRSLKDCLQQIKESSLNPAYSIRQEKNMNIPPLNLDKRYFSPYFPSKRTRESCNGLTDNYSRDSKKTNNTDRRSEKVFNPSTMPSSIFSDSENSITERSESKVSSKKKIVSLKDVDSFFDFVASEDCKKPADRKSFFSQKVRKNNSKSLQRFVGSYELFSLEKILKQNIEKLMIKKFYKWKFGSKKKKYQTDTSKRKLSTSVKLFSNLFRKIVQKSYFKRLFERSKESKVRCISKFVECIKKDIKYRTRICLNIWKKESLEKSIEMLKVLAFFDCFKSIRKMRKSWTFTLLKIINNKSGFY